MLYINKKGGLSTKRIERNMFEGKKREKSRKNRYCSSRKATQEAMLAYA